MKIAVWKTGHEIADTVAEAVEVGFRAELHHTQKLSALSPDAVCIAYGILRGTRDIFSHNMDGMGQNWFNIDRGYFSPGHFDGYYRISYRGTQAKYDVAFPCGLYDVTLTPKRVNGAYALICPPTPPVCDFFNLNYEQWCNSALAEAESVGLCPLFRMKDDARPLAEMLVSAGIVITFNSSVGWRAIQKGIPCLSDANHSVVGSYYGENHIEPLFKKFHALPRKPLFNFMRAHQFTLDEIRAGQAWNLIKHYISISDGTAGKPLPPMSAPTPYGGVHHFR